MGWDKRALIFGAETDSLHFSSLAADLPRAHLFRLETIDYIRECLTDENGASHNPCSNSVITCFRPVGKAVRESCTDGKQLLKLALFPKLKVPRSAPVLLG